MIGGVLTYSNTTKMRARPDGGPRFFAGASPSSSISVGWIGSRTMKVEPWFSPGLVAMISP